MRESFKGRADAMSALAARHFRIPGVESQRDSGSKPKVATEELPWETRRQGNNPNGVVAWSWIFDATPLGLKSNFTVTQGSLCLATLGSMTQSLWDCRTSALKSA